MRRDLPGPTAFFYPPLRLQAVLVMRRDGRYTYPSGGVRAPCRWGCTAFLVACHWLRNP